MTEADTGRECATPKQVEAGWGAARCDHRALAPRRTVDDLQAHRRVARGCLSTASATLNAVRIHGLAPAVRTVDDSGPAGLLRWSQIG